MPNFLSEAILERNSDRDFITWNIVIRRIRVS